jgi:geranylgeranyl diphosphate synthase, type II
MDIIKDAIERRLADLFQDDPESRLKDAALYVVKAGGKRFRPRVILTLVQSYGLDPMVYLDLACGLELIHLYSLVHDDLPAMDNDTMRHGKPTVHIAYDEATAILVGDGFLTKAFGCVASSLALTDAQKVDAIHRLSTHAGLAGMIHGQHLDLKFEKKQPSLNELEQISYYKTGKLLSVAFQLGALIAQPNAMAQWTTIGHDLGLLFQIQDDVLEATTSEENMKKSKSDDHLEKATFVRILGLDESRKKIMSLQHRILHDLRDLKMSNSAIRQLIDTILTRQY